MAPGFFYLRGLPPIWASRPDLFVADDGLHLLEGRVLTDEVEEGKLEVLRHPVDFAPETTDNRLQLFYPQEFLNFVQLCLRAIGEREKGFLA